MEKEEKDERKMKIKMEMNVKMKIDVPALQDMEKGSDEGDTIVNRHSQFASETSVNPSHEVANKIEMKETGTETGTGTEIGTKTGTGTEIGTKTGTGTGVTAYVLHSCNSLSVSVPVSFISILFATSCDGFTEVSVAN